MRALFLAIALLLGMQGAIAQETRGAPAGDFDFYVLSLSWSASFCSLKGEARGNPQCESGRHPGFVLHGLWPQYERGFPSFCEPQGRNPSRDAMARAEQIFPDPGLARHQWRKHGSCSGLPPRSYFDAAATALAKVTIPPEFLAPASDAPWDVLAVERAFVAANPGLRTDMMAVTCRAGLIEEVRICLSKDGRDFRACREVDQRACRLRSLTIPAAR